MNPELPSPQFNPEQPATNYEQGGELGQNLANPERAGERTPEREQNMRSIDRNSTPLPPPVFPIPIPQTPVQQPAQTVVVDDGNPVLAGDDDLIEKEWVDKAKKIITETRDDPYAREREVNKLQADYLQKRYGKELGSSD
ncbi:hypothetical protein A2707_05365 [Candidatus Saccharibacteria bacterium RIFCSPHIGHO2_01_FULL_45_15]|nr:MAG: hypothetical protein A2707_05365 [Candidatus Saccharibacteria bacterium RIFCSPHIGHO2_01_FULL_45_15]OGL27398.1 MAG: hypothetical protein A3C39_05130 [Candidatus Saccharibacteria bacterium RIFCSPHIGHO2_02_FULL_46_12]OGL32612.1 MAG: hypothetical protein A3E76_04600 [Candidatus Saccharibacteria bacterium RIFCSPHIGHO2_12_FULL_44_22]